MGEVLLYTCDICDFFYSIFLLASFHISHDTMFIFYLCNTICIFLHKSFTRDMISITITEKFGYTFEKNITRQTSLLRYF